MWNHKDLLTLPFLIVSLATVANGKITPKNITVTTYTAYLVENAPYVWKRDGTPDGMIPQLIRIIQKECQQFRIDIHIVNWSMQELDEIIRAEDPIKLIQAKQGYNNNTLNDNIILGASNFNDLNPHEKLISMPVVHSRGLAGIVHRESIGIGLKLYHAMCDSMLIIYNGLLLTVIAGIVLWWVESKWNTEMFPQTVSDGLLNGIWCAIVTMTTVGYGDIVPKTKLGKILCIIYMLLCTLIIAALTSVYTERMTNADVDFKGKTISVVNGTWDITVAQRYGKKSNRDEQQTIKFVSTYFEALEKVANREVYATLIDYNVAAWFQHEIFEHDLRFTKYIDQQFDQYLHVYGHHLINKHDVMHDLMVCFDNGMKLTRHNMENYVQPITFIRLDMPDMSYAIRTLGITPIFTGVTALILLLVIFYACFKRCTKRNEKKKKFIISDILAEKDRELTLRFLEKKLEEKLNRIKADIVNDYKELLEDNTFNRDIMPNTERSELFILH